jgi:hypothetical protein
VFGRHFNALEACLLACIENRCVIKTLLGEAPPYKCMLEHWFHPLQFWLKVKFIITEKWQEL